MQYSILQPTTFSLAGVELAYSDILEKPIDIVYSLAHTDVDDDKIGKRFDSLERDGWLHEAQAEYAFRLGRGMSIVPGFVFSFADLDGNASSYEGDELERGLRKS